MTAVSFRPRKKVETLLSDTFVLKSTKVKKKVNFYYNKKYKSKKKVQKK